MSAPVSAPASMGGALLTALAALAPGVARQEPSPQPQGMVLVPAGPFVMGADDGNFDEAPAHRVHVSAFYLDRCEVTNAQFADFARSSGAWLSVEGPWFRTSVEGCLDLIAHCRQSHGAKLADLAPLAADDHERRMRESNTRARWRSALLALRDMLGEDESFPGQLTTGEIEAVPRVQELREAQSTLPVRYVTWRDAATFARWAGKRLPTEAEWEKAARGTDARVWPWGEAWSPERCRTGLEPRRAAIFDPHAADVAAPSGPAPVGSHPAGASPYGCLDMSGNVWEWVHDWYGERTYVRDRDTRDPTGPAGLPDGRLPEPYSESALLRTPAQGRSTDTRKVLRGGGWAGPPNQSRFNTRATRRLWSNPDYWHSDVGFRCAQDV